MKHIARYAAPAIILLASPSFLTSQGRQPPRLVLNALDLDHDGILSTSEIAAAARSLLTLDRNGDGQLTYDELSGRPENAIMDANDYVRQLMSFDRSGKGFLFAADLPERMQGIFSRGDSNQDSKLTPEEIRALAAKMSMPQGPRASSTGRAEGMFRTDPMMGALDTNHDGAIDGTEILNAPAALLTLDVNGDGQLTPGETAIRQPTVEDRIDHLLSEWDTNKDGRLTRNELPDGMVSQMDAIDANHDGVLDRLELINYSRAHPQGQRGSGGPPQAQGAGDRPHSEHH